jgi:adenylate cyclase
VPGKVTEQQLRLKELYSRARRAYQAQEWDLAEAAFRECLQLRPEDGPSRVFIQRIQTFRQHPPDANWTGVWQLVAK